MIDVRSSSHRCCKLTKYHDFRKSTKQALNRLTSYRHAATARIRFRSIEECLRRRKTKPVGLRHRLAGDLALADIYAFTKMDVVLQRLSPTLLCKPQDE